MKKLLKMTVPILCFIALLFSMIMPAVAAEMPNSIQRDGEDLVFGEYRITFDIAENGDTIICEYKNERLAQKNTVPSDTQGVAIREFYGNSPTQAISTDQIYAEDYGITASRSVQPMSDYSSYSPYGIIVYKVVLDTETIYPRQGVKLAEKYDTTTYKIKSYVGRVVDLVTLLVSSGIAVSSITTGFVGNLLIAAGIKVVGDSITSALSTTVACERTSYSWYLYNVYDSNHYKYYDAGAMYRITDTVYHTGEVYYEGVTPKDWGTTYMANIFYAQMFAGDAWCVHQWISR